MLKPFIIKSLFMAFCFYMVIISPVSAQIAISKQKQDKHIGELVNKAKSFFKLNPDSTLVYGKMVLDYATRHNNSAGQAEGYNIMGNVYQYEGKIPEAIDAFRKGIEIASKAGHDKVHSILLLNKGNAEEGLGNYVIALEDFIASVRIKEKIGDSLGIGKCFNNIAQIYSRQGNHEEALKNFFRSLEIKKQFKDSASINNTYNNIGVNYNNMGEYDKALPYILKTKEYYMRKGRPGDVAMITGNLAWTYDLMGKKDTALKYYLEALAILEKEGDPTDLVVTRINIASLYLEKNEFSKAELQLQLGLKESLLLNSKEDIREAYKYLSELHAKKGEYQKAFEFQRKFQVVSDSILNEEKAATLAEMHVKYESAKKDEQNKVLQKENEINGILLERNRHLNIGLGVFSLLILIIALLFIKQTRLAARQHTIELEQKVLRSQMNPHFIFNSLQSIQGFIFESHALEAGKYLSDFSRLMRLILENSKSELITLSKEIETLQYYLVLQQLRFANKMDYSLEVDESIDTEAFLVPPMLLQPCIENAIEHGIRRKEGKGKVMVSIRHSGDYFTFVVEDDGVGRNHSPENPQAGNSIHKSRATEITMERLELYNKKSLRKIRMTITDLLNPSGTIVIFEVPVKELI